MGKSSVRIRDQSDARLRAARKGFAPFKAHDGNPGALIYDAMGEVLALRRALRNLLAPHRTVDLRKDQDYARSLLSPPKGKERKK